MASAGCPGRASPRDACEQMGADGTAQAKPRGREKHNLLEGREALMWPEWHELGEGSGTKTGASQGGLAA